MGNAVIMFTDQIQWPNIHILRLVHVPWYDILRHYFGMILQYFQMKICYDF